MAFGSDLLGGQWCSPKDCESVFGDVDAVVEDPAQLDRCIRQATGRAKSNLRVQWPDEDWPFSTPPDELRDAVAAIATYNACRGPLLRAGNTDTTEQLRLMRKDALEWLEEIANGDAYLDVEDGVDDDFDQPAIARGPRGEFGFGK